MDRKMLRATILQEFYASHRIDWYIDSLYVETAFSTLDKNCDLWKAQLTSHIFLRTVFDIQAGLYRFSDCFFRYPVTCVHYLHKSNSNLGAQTAISFCILGAYDFYEQKWSEILANIELPSDYLNQRSNPGLGELQDTWLENMLSGNCVMAWTWAYSLTYHRFKIQLEPPEKYPRCRISILMEHMYQNRFELA